MQALLGGRHADDLDALVIDMCLSVMSHPPGSSTDLVLYCTSGRHRSVATALILFGALSHLGITVAVSHMGSAWWKFVNCQRRAWDHSRGGVHGKA